MRLHRWAEERDDHNSVKVLSQNFSDLCMIQYYVRNLHLKKAPFLVTAVLLNLEFVWKCSRTFQTFSVYGNLLPQRWKQAQSRLTNCLETCQVLASKICRSLFGNSTLCNIESVIKGLSDWFCPIDGVRNVDSELFYGQRVFRENESFQWFETIGS